MTETLIEELRDHVNYEVKDLSDADYCEVLEEISSTFQDQARCKRDEMEAAE